jgi:XRE family transcriptional regulator, regulator of sulfur utilization
LSASTVGQRIAQDRHERAWTQEQLAAAAGLHKQTISDIERGSKTGSRTLLLALASVLQVPPDRYLDTQPAAPTTKEGVA